MNPTTTSSVYSNTDTIPDVPCGTDQARQYHARLVMHEGRRYCALTEEGAIWVTAAAGCLLQPAVGDVALVSIAGTNGYVLSILERGRPDQPAVLAVDGKLRLQAGKMEIAAQDGLSLDAGPSLRVNAGTAHVELNTAQVRCQALSMEGASLHTHWNQRADIAGERITIASYSETHLGQSTRRIAGHEEVVAASFRQAVTRDWTVRAGTATLVGRDRAAIDGNSVQIG